MVEVGTVWLLMIVLNQNPGPAYLSGNITVESFEPAKGMSTIQGSVAYNLAPGKEKVWAELTTRVDKTPRHQIIIFRFDTGKVYRLNPEKKTYSERPLSDPAKMLTELRAMYLGGAEGKASARTIEPPKGITETRTTKQVEAKAFTTIFYVDTHLESAVTRVDVNAKGENMAVVTKITEPNIAPVPDSKFEVPADYTKTK